MRCDRHGELIADWTSCPYCIRDKGREAGLTSGPPRPPALQNWAADATRGAPPNGNAAQVTRGNFGGGDGGGSSPANVTRGAVNDASGFGFGRGVANVTRIVDPPPLARRKVRAWLIQKDGPRPDQVHPIKDDVTWIGRDPRADIFIDDDSVSGQHAKVWVDGDKTLRLLNVSTSNGTQVNGVRMEAPVELRENDEVRMGKVVLVLKRLDEPPAHGAQTAASAQAAAPQPSSTLDPGQPGLDERLAALVKQLVDAQVAAVRAAATPPQAPAAAPPPESAAQAAPVPPPSLPADPWGPPVPSIEKTQPMPRAGLAGRGQNTTAPDAATLNLDETWTAGPPSAVSDTAPGNTPSPFRPGGA